MAFNYGAGFIVKRRKQGWVLAAIIAANIGALIWFKYANTFLGLMADAGLPLTIDKVLFPLAISFFTFRQIAYVIDVRNGVAEIPGFAEYAFVITFFPNLIAGPLVRHSEMVQQLRAGALRPDWTNFAVGVTLFSIGLFKKVVLSEMARPYADRVFDGAPVIEHLTFVTAWTGSLAYGLQIYFDFSGYSDMAIGLARMFGFKLPLNFHSPYK
ncbi:MAG TPA: MBOAT family O-acyltransferase, partial [Candidatus Omnitrophota bacterium]|nr:MBOAT family O-acyltransferase [Candidatus Omnitrophota bacterium]